MAALTLFLVFWLGNSSAWVEWNLALAAVALGLFLLLAGGLYQGVRLARPRPADADVRPMMPRRLPLVDAAPALGSIGVELPEMSDAGDNLAGCLVTFMLWLAATILITILTWLAIEFLVIVLPALLLGVYWIYYRALRLVFSKSRLCRGRLRLSLGYALLYTFVYTGWLFAVTWLAWFVLEGRLPG